MLTKAPELMNGCMQAKNIVNYLRVIHRILAPGGVWINCGPLLWHFENSEEISIELSLDEVKSLATQIGFVIQVRPVLLLFPSFGSQNKPQPKGKCAAG